MPFREKALAAQRKNNTCLCVSLDIVPANSPISIQQYDEPMLPFAREIIAATQNLVCAYVINPAYYMAEGAAGMVALERIVRAVPSDIPIICDARLGDMDGADFYLRGVFEQLKCDAITLGISFFRSILQIQNAYTNQHYFYPAGTLSDKGVKHYGGWVDAGKPESLLAFDFNLSWLVMNSAAHPTATKTFVKTHTALRDGLRPLCAVGAEVLYASRTASFAEDARAAALALREQFL
jgi:hypothetical protein